MLDSELTTQVAIVSSLPDRPRIEPLVRGLRARGIDVWWDGDDLLPGEEWEKKTWAILQQAPITCVLLSEASLASPQFRRAIDVSLVAKKHLVPIRVGTFDRATPLPNEITQRQWVDFLTPDDLERALEELEQAVRSVTGAAPSSSAPPPTSQRRVANTRPAGPSGSTRASAPPPPIALLLGDTPSPETWVMSPELLNVLDQAARLHPKGSGEPPYPLSFSTLLSALFWTEGTWGQWSQGIAKQSGFDVTKLRPIPVTPAEVSRPLRATRSAASLLQTAREHALRSGATLDVQHLIAALLYEPAGHESELESYHFDRVIWANALIDEVERRAPAEVGLFTALRDKAFPVMKAPPPASSIPESSAPVDRNVPQEQAAAPGTDPWSLANEDLKMAFAWASAASQSTPSGPGVVGVRELFAGLMQVLAKETWLVDVLVSVSPGLGAEPGQPPWGPIYHKLALPLPSSAPALAELPPRTAEVDAVLAKAIAIEKRRDSTAESSLSEAAAFVALWQPGTAGEAAAIDALLPELDLDADAFLQRLQEHEESSHADVAMLQEIRALRGAFRPWNRPHVDNDRVGGPITQDKDLLDARKPALRFAKLLAAKDVNPPIALGLFGNWGSGKTFFMGLMRDRIADLVKTGGGDYVHRVVQIEFNAWHYHDTNLWASLAMRIFEELARELAGPKEDEVQAKRKELHQKIRSSEARRSEAEERRKEALARRSTVANELETRLAEREELQRRSVRRRLEAAWQVVTTDKAFAALQVTAGGLSRHFGITAGIESAEDLQRLRRDIDETSGRALGLFTAIGQRFQGFGPSARTTALLVLVAAAVLALGSGFERVAELLKIRLPDFSATVLQVAALVSTAAAWCGRRVKEIRGAIDRIAQVEAALAAAEKTVLPIELQRLQTQITSLDKLIHQAGEELSAAEREIADATAEIDRINRGGLVYDFLQERRSAASYVGQLGLISTIRQDLERLAVLLKDFVEAGKDPIERIILYVDDLDRCHPDKVVEVLQAVHLLLAFDLFNVVVGVDARWLERSLRRQYVGRGGGARTQSDDPFSPQDYLEKIFQIPYALSRIDEEGFKRLIGGLIETRSEYTDKERQRAREAAAKAAAAAQGATGAGAADTPAPEATRAEEAKPADAEHGASADARDRKPGDSAADAAKTGQPERSMAATPALYFEDHEEKFIQLLYAFIDRPRLVKRFINIYRLLRVRADDEGESARFAGASSSPEYRAALILLAIHVGHPTVAAKVIDAIDRVAKDRTWPALLDDLVEGRVEGVMCTEREKSEIAAVASKLARVSKRVPEELEAYRSWAPRVACYSFDWHRTEPIGRQGGGPRMNTSTK